MFSSILPRSKKQRKPPSRDRPRLSPPGSPASFYSPGVHVPSSPPPMPPLPLPATSPTSAFPHATRFPWGPAAGAAAQAKHGSAANPGSAALSNNTSPEIQIDLGFTNEPLFEFPSGLFDRRRSAAVLNMQPPPSTESTPTKSALAPIKIPASSSSSLPVLSPPPPPPNPKSSPLHAPGPATPHPPSPLSSASSRSSWSTGSYSSGFSYASAPDLDWGISPGVSYAAPNAASSSAFVSPRRLSLSSGEHRLTRQDSATLPFDPDRDALFEGAHQLRRERSRCKSESEHLSRRNSEHTCSEHRKSHTRNSSRHSRRTSKTSRKSMSRPGSIGNINGMLSPSEPMPEGAAARASAGSGSGNTSAGGANGSASSSRSPSQSQAPSHRKSARRKSTAPSPAELKALHAHLPSQDQPSPTVHLHAHPHRVSRISEVSSAASGSPSKKTEGEGMVDFGDVLDDSLEGPFGGAYSARGDGAHTYSARTPPETEAGPSMTQSQGAGVVVGARQPKPRTVSLRRGASAEARMQVPPPPVRPLPPSPPASVRSQGQGQGQPQNGQVRSQNGQGNTQNGQVKSPNGQVKSPNGQAKSPNGQAKSPNGQAKSPSGQVKSQNDQVQVQVQVQPPNGQVQPQNGHVQPQTPPQPQKGSLQPQPILGHKRKISDGVRLLPPSPPVDAPQEPPPVQSPPPPPPPPPPPQSQLVESPLAQSPPAPTAESPPANAQRRSFSAPTMAPSPPGATPQSGTLGSPGSRAGQVFSDLHVQLSPEPRAQLSPEPRAQLSPEPRAGLSPESRTGMSPESRTGMSPESRAGFSPGFSPESRMAFSPDSRVGFSPESRMQFSPESRVQFSPDASSLSLSASASAGTSHGSSSALWERDLDSATSIPTSQGSNGGPFLGAVGIRSASPAGSVGSNRSGIFVHPPRPAFSPFAPEAARGKGKEWEEKKNKSTSDVTQQQQVPSTPGSGYSTTTSTSNHSTTTAHGPGVRRMSKHQLTPGSSAAPSNRFSATPLSPGSPAPVSARIGMLPIGSSPKPAGSALERLKQRQRSGSEPGPVSPLVRDSPSQSVFHAAFERPGVAAALLHRRPVTESSSSQFPETPNEFSPLFTPSSAAAAAPVAAPAPVPAPVPVTVASSSVLSVPSRQMMPKPPVIDPPPPPKRSRPPLPIGPRKPSVRVAGTSQPSGLSTSITATSPPHVVRPSSAASTQQPSSGTSSGNKQGFTPPSPKFQTRPVRWRGLTMDAAKWTFTSGQLQDIVGRAIRQSAEASSIRLLTLEVLDKELPEEIRRLEALREEIKSKYRASVRRRRVLFKSMTLYAESSDTQTRSRLSQDLLDCSLTCDQLSEDLFRVMDEIQQINKLRDVHSASALAMALRKLNSSFVKQSSDMSELRMHMTQLEAERDEAWQTAERVERDLVDVQAKMEMLNGSAPNSAVPSNRSSRVSAARKTSIRASKASLRFSRGTRSSHSSSTSSNRLSSLVAPPVPPMPRLLNSHQLSLNTDLPSASAGSSYSMGMSSTLATSPTPEALELAEAQNQLYDMLGITRADVRRGRSARYRPSSEFVSPSSMPGSPFPPAPSGVVTRPASDVISSPADRRRRGTSLSYPRPADSMYHDVLEELQA